MIYLFSSASKNQYKQDVLDACCYPEGHVMRFRYSERLVPEGFRFNPGLLVGETGLIVFASQLTVGSAKGSTDEGTASQGDFTFLPIRECTIVDAAFSATILIVDVSLGGFMNYGSSADFALERQWDGTIKEHSERPFPAGNPKEGLFIYRGLPLRYKTQTNGDDIAWKSVIERINRSELAECVTFRVLGFFRLGRWRDHATALTGRVLLQISKLISGRGQIADRLAVYLGSFRRSAEGIIRGSVKGPDCAYVFPMGKTVVLKLFFYRSTALDGANRCLKLRLDPRAFTSSSETDFHLRSRYDESRVLLSCARNPDPIYSALSIIQQPESSGPCSADVWAPQPLFVTLVKAPWLFLPMVAVAFGIVLLLLNLSSVDIQTIAANWGQHGGWKDVICKLPPKPLGTLLVIVASWQYLRKFPLK